MILHSPIVLMYHGISSASCPGPEGRETGAELYDVSLSNFKTQMQYIKESRYKPVLVEDVPSISRSVVLTFDDGELNNFCGALPLLCQFGWKAYFFVIAKRVGQKGYMSWEELKALIQCGMVVGSHGMSHAILTSLLDSQMQEELRASKQNLEINLNTTIDTLSIPRGFCNDKIIETAYSLGYKTVFISQRPFTLKSECMERVAVLGNWSLKRFKIALEGRRPLIEVISDKAKELCKGLLHETGYNWTRSAAIKLLK